MNNIENLVPIIGLEIHCQLNTKSKLFCSCSSDFRNDDPNTHVCPVCLGHPGTLPTLNKKAVEYGLKVGLALNCEILECGLFCRKNYFYPDLPKSFQITMGDQPLAKNGYLIISDSNQKNKKINIERIHLEEDPGRLVHIENDSKSYTLVDYNRSGIPLIEIVTKPEIESPKEARSFINKLRSILEYLNVFEPEKEGGIRIDANISIKGYNRVEIKNISSYRGVEKALIYEIERQKNIIKNNGIIIRETRHYHEDTETTTSGRNKENAVDYRYFVEPDLPAIKVKEWIKDIILPELPDSRIDRFIKEYKISKHHSVVLSSNLKLADFYEKIATINPLVSATWIVDIIIGELNYRNLNIKNILDYHQHVTELITLLNNKEITDKVGITIIRYILDQIAKNEIPDKPLDIIQRLDLKKETGESFRKKIMQIISENEKAVLDHISGKKGALNFIIGKIMKETNGKADPLEIKNIIEDIINKK